MGIIKDSLKVGLYGDLYAKNFDVNGNVDFQSSSKYFNKIFDMKKFLGVSTYADASNRAKNNYTLKRFNFTIKNFPFISIASNSNKVARLRTLFKAIVLTKNAKSVGVTRYVQTTGAYYLVNVNGSGIIFVPSSNTNVSLASTNISSSELDVEIIDRVKTLNSGTGLNLTASECDVFYNYVLKYMNNLGVSESLVTDDVESNLMVSQIEYDNHYGAFLKKINGDYTNIGLMNKWEAYSSIYSSVLAFLYNPLFPKNILKIESLSDLEIQKTSLLAMLDETVKFDSFIANRVQFISNFNFLIAVRDHYLKYQSTAFLFAPQGNKEQLSAITSGNFLKLLQTQVAVLTPTAFTTVGSIANKTTFGIDILNLIRITTMGYLKYGDVVTTDVAKFFKVNDEVNAILARITAISSIVNGVPVPPAFIYNTVGSIVSSSTVPSGADMINLINQILIEADKNFTYIGL